ncbi:MAG: thioester reductase domain-containing protein [Pseudomonadales bacterium]
MTKKKYPKFADRVLELTKNDPQLKQHMPRVDLWEALADDSVPLATNIDRLMEGYGDRPALGEREYTLEDTEGNGQLTRRYGPGFNTVSYAEFRHRVRSIASAWRTEGSFYVSPDEFVCMMGFAGVDYSALDVACLYTQTVSVPVQANYGFDMLRGMLELIEPTLIATATADLDMAVRLAEAIPSIKSFIVFDYDAADSSNSAAWEAAQNALAERCPNIAVTSLDELALLGNADSWEMMPPHKEGPERLTSIIHSSGSTGTPKGAMLPERSVVASWNGVSPNAPAIGIGLAPLNHLMGRLMTQGTMGVGGLVNFTLADDMSTLIEDIRATRPINIAFVPRIVDMIYQDYLNQVSRRANDSGVSESQAREEILNEFRGSYLGDRLLGGSVGSAPTTKEMRDFMMACFNMPLVDGYGSTESGTGRVTFNNRILRPGVIDYKLRDMPELGYLTSDKPYPRGEFCIKTKTQILGYYKNPKASAKLLDEEGYYLSGDIVEERGPDHVVVIDRCNDVLKLSQGEYVAVGRLGTIFESESDLIQQIYVYGNSLRSYLVATVVPDMQALKSVLGDTPESKAILALIREDFQRIARSVDLKSFEIPREFILEQEPFTAENGLLTSVLKKKRPALKEKYGEQLEALYEQGEQLKSEQLGKLKDPDSSLSTVEKLRILLASNLGIEEQDVDDAKTYHEHGGDSLGSVTFAMAIENIFGKEIPSNDILSPAGGINSWAKILNSGADSRLSNFSEVHGERSDEIFANDLKLEKFLPSDVLANAASLAMAAPEEPRTVFLTGANGFLGRVVCLEWLKRLSENGGKLICLIRAADDQAAKSRLREVFGVAGEEMSSAFDSYQAYLEVVAGDFGQPYLGLTPDRFAALASQVDLISHGGALVNHVMDYQSLFVPNVGGMAEIIRFALSGKKKPIDFVSSVSVTPHLQFNTGGTETAELAVSAKLNDRYANGYGASKWAGEQLLREAHQRFGLPVRIFRGDMMLAHRQIAGVINSDDMFTRLLYSVIKTGVAPKSFYEANPDGSRALVPYDGMPVNIVAASVVNGGQYFLDGATVFCIDNPFSDLANSLDAFVDWIIESGYDIQRLQAHEDWFSRFKRRMTALPEAEQKQSALALLKAFERPNSFVPFRGESSNFQALISKMGVAPSELQLDAEFMYKCLNDMALHGLIEKPSKKPGEKRANKPETTATQAYGVTSNTSDIAPMSIERRLPGSKDVAIDIEYCGVCHSDIHFAHNDWGATQYPLVPGHEIVGRVAAVGSEVAEFKVGERVAVGCLVDSCRTCESCEEGLEQYCDGGQVMTYNSYDHRHQNTLTFGGYSNNIVVDKDFVMAVPENLDPAGAAPLLCAGITTWSPLREWNIKKGMRVGVVGLGGLGHMAVKFSAALGAHTVMISTSREKADDARRLGADEVLISKDLDAMREAKESFDFILDTVPVNHDVDDYLRLLKRDATLCLVGALEPLEFHSGRVAMRRKKISGSSIGSIAETRDMLAFCGEHNITADIELIKPDGIQTAWSRVQSSDVKYRFVIDMQAAG